MHASPKLLERTGSWPLEQVLDSTALRCRANVARTRQPLPVSGLGFHAKICTAFLFDLIISMACRDAPGAVLQAILVS